MTLVYAFPYPEHWLLAFFCIVGRIDGVWGFDIESFLCFAFSVMAMVHE
jgi:hypothetical protein